MLSPGHSALVVREPYILKYNSSWNSFHLLSTPSLPPLVTKLIIYSTAGKSTTTIVILDTHSQTETALSCIHALLSACSSAPSIWLLTRYLARLAEQVILAVNKTSGNWFSFSLVLVTAGKDPLLVEEYSCGSSTTEEWRWGLGRRKDASPHIKACTAHRNTKATNDDWQNRHCPSTIPKATP